MQPSDLDELGARVTVAPLPEGGSLARVHGPDGVADPNLAAAAARAAVLVLERVRLTTQLRVAADELRRSAARLLAVDDQERRPSPRAARGWASAPAAEGTHAHRAGRCGTTRRGGRRARSAGALSVNLHSDGTVDGLPEAGRALVYFVIAE
jgi:hypothetical protein